MATAAVDVTGAAADTITAGTIAAAAAAMNPTQLPPRPRLARACEGLRTEPFVRAPLRANTARIAF